MIQCSIPASFGESQVLGTLHIVVNNIRLHGCGRSEVQCGAPRGNVKQFFSVNHTAGGYGIRFLKFEANQRLDMNAIIQKGCDCLAKSGC